MGKRSIFSGAYQVVKHDCIRQVQKRLGKALHEFQGTASKLEDGKLLKGRKSGILTKTAIEKMKRSCGKAIYNHVNRGIYSVEERDATAHAMQTEIMAGLYYSTRQRKTQVMLEQFLVRVKEENSLPE